MEPGYEEYDQVLALQFVRDDNPQFLKIALEELIIAQYQDKLCSDIGRVLNERERLSFTHEGSGLLIPTISNSAQIVIAHSFKE